MSIAFTASTTNSLRVTLASPLTIGTGAANVASWFRMTSLNLLVQEPWVLGDQVDPTGTNRWGWQIDSVAGLDIMGYLNTGATTSVVMTLALHRCYYLVASRNATVMRWRIFGDDPNMTKLAELQEGTNDNYTALDTIMIGQRGFGHYTPASEYENFKIHTTTEWTDAECRTEARTYGIQKSGGVDRLCFELQNINATPHGLLERAGVIGLTNSGATAGTIHPDPLERNPWLTTRIGG